MLFQFFPSVIQKFWPRPERFYLNIGIHFTSIFICLFIYSDSWANTKRSDKIKIQNYYKYWKDKYFRVSQRVKGGAYIDYQNNQTTCSAALGYGMLISIYMSRLHENNTRNDFDALNRFRRQFSS